MKIEFNRASLATTIGIVQTVLPSKTPKPILQNVLLEIRGGKATLTGSDSEIAIRHDVADANSTGSGSVLLPRRVGEVLREMRDERVSLVIEEKKIQLCGERSRFNIPTEDPSDYPEFKSPEDAGSLTLPGSLLKKMIRRTVFATDVAESGRYALGGVLFDVGPSLSMVATDQRRLSLITAPIDGHKPSDKAVTPVVPSKALSLLERTIPDSSDVVHMAFEANQTTFTMEHATITTRLVEGRFPRYKDVIPRSHTFAVELIAGMLNGVIRQSLIFTSDESRGVDFSFSEGVLSLASQAASVGDAQIELPISFSGEPAVVRLDPRFISEFLKTIPAETQISLKFTGEESPVVVTTDDNSTYVIMPLSRD